MPALSVERLQAPSGGINSDASPDYVAVTQAPILQNMLPGEEGKVACRGPIDNRIINVSAASTTATVCWTIDDTALLRLADGTTQKADLAALTASDVTATVGQVPASSAHARYGSKIYGAITDGTTSPALGSWAGGAITKQTNAPYGFKDVQVYAQRLFVLGGTVPGTTTPVNARTLYWTDPSTTADLSLTASWVDDVSGLTNQLVIDTDDTPVALASCGRFMAILGTRSINVLTGSGSSSFAVRNVTKNWGVTNLESVVEVDDGFFFQSSRGYCFCDGTAVTLVSGGVTQALLALAAAGTLRAAAFDGGYVAVGATGATSFYLLHVATRTWALVSSQVADINVDVFRSSAYPFVWARRSVFRCEKITRTGLDIPRDVGGFAIECIWRTRALRLGSPLQDSVVSRIVIDYQAQVASTSANKPGVNGWSVSVLTDDATQLAFAYLPTVVQTTVQPARQRYVIDVQGEFSTLQLYFDWAFGASAPEMLALELYDVYVEYAPAQNLASF